MAVNKSDPEPMTWPLAAAMIGLVACTAVFVLGMNYVAAQDFPPVGSCSKEHTAWTSTESECARQGGSFYIPSSGPMWSIVTVQTRVSTTVAAKCPPDRSLVMLSDKIPKCAKDLTDPE